jgi:DNA-nicking Smr family endonuclease
MAKDRQSLSDEEAALWNRVVDTAVPLRRKQPHTVESIKKPTAESGKKKRPLPAPSRNGAPRDERAQRPPPARNPDQIDRRTARRIARGSISLDGRLDLHGLTQAQAHERLTDFVGDAQESGLRTVLIITGKGAGDGTERGILKRALPQWLSTSPLRDMVLEFEVAHREHGGSGAFYVRLRRLRE